MIATAEAQEIDREALIEAVRTIETGAGVVERVQMDLAAREDGSLDLGERWLLIGFVEELILDAGLIG